jgi:hypothetical protein
MSAKELVDYGFTILFIYIYIYRPPDSNFQIILKILESIMQKTQSIKKHNIMCGGLEFKFYGIK